MPRPDSREPELPRARLLRVLALDADATPGEIQRRGLLLLRALRERRAGPDVDTTSGADLDREIADLESALGRHARGAKGKARRPVGRVPMDRTTMIGIGLGAICAIALFLWTSSAVGPHREAVSLERVLRRMPSQLVLTGSLEDATLRVFDADRSAVLHEGPAQDAQVELQPGRYAIEVTRPGCAEPWTRSFYFESGTMRTFAPNLCSGEGGLRVRTNVESPTISVDDARVELPSDGVIPLPAGEHAVRIEKIGHRPHSSTVRIRPNHTQDLAVDLAPARPSGDPRAEPQAFPKSAARLERPQLPPPEPFDFGELQQQVAPRNAKQRASRLLDRAGLGGFPDGGSTAWHDRVAGEFLRRFDTDESGRIDRLDETDGISCDHWVETEASFDDGGLGLSMARYYGFDGTEWHPGALGFDRAMRGAAYERMRACGLQG